MEVVAFIMAFLLGPAVFALLPIFFLWRKVARLEKRLGELELHALENQFLTPSKVAPPPPEPRSNAPATTDDVHRPSTPRGETVPTPHRSAPKPSPVRAPVTTRAQTETRSQASDVQPPDRPPPAKEDVRDDHPPIPSPHTELEEWIGVRGAAVVGGVVLILALFMLAKISIDRGWVTVPVRIGVGFLLSIVAIILSRPAERRGKSHAAQALAAGGFVGIYAASWAGVL